ncbi:MAG: DHH family phosphoesterase [Euryarchaeota archaeon]|nr:DHH family phosphoesterase [Euryarchaeota archaeon]
MKGSGADALLVPEGLDDALGKAIAALSGSEGAVRIVTHYDADGLSAGGVMCRALLRIGRPFHVRVTRKPEPAFFESLADEDYRLNIFLDCGSGQLELVERLRGNAIVLDHHKPGAPPKRAIEVNPHRYGIDGATELSASTLAYLFARKLDRCNVNLFPYALAGALGDRQDLGGLRGLNKGLLAEAEKAGVVEQKRALKLAEGKVRASISDSINPYFKGLGGREDAVKSLLSSIGISADADLSALTPDERRALTSILTLRLLEHGAPPESVAELNPMRYWSTELEIFVDRLSGMINACGRMGDEATGLAVCLGDASAVEAAKKHREAYLAMVREGLAMLEGDGAKQMAGLQYFWWDNPAITGSICGLGVQFVLDKSKPVFGLTEEGDKVSISARGTRALVAAGLDLSAACREAAGAVGGRGGGHDVASGATVPKGKAEEFLAIADAIVSKHLGRISKGP